MARRHKYGAQHNRARAAAIRRTPPDAPCCRCGLPLDQPGAAARPGSPDPVELDHDDQTGGYAGLAHRSCNRSAGAIKGAVMAGKRLRQRRCLVCGVPIVVSDGKTATCGQGSCVATLKAARRAREPDPEPPPVTGREW